MQGTDPRQRQEGTQSNHQGDIGSRQGINRQSNQKGGSRPMTPVEFAEQFQAIASALSAQGFEFGSFGGRD